MNLYIDADSLLYRASHLVCCKDDKALEEAQELEDKESEDIELQPATAEDTLGGMKRIFHSMKQEIVEAVISDAEAKGYKIDGVYNVLTVKFSLKCCKGLADNFRYGVMADVKDEKVKGYKSNRAGMPVPEGLNDIYEYVFNLPDTICESGVEADDVCVYYGQNGHMVAALDKDVLGSLEYAYNYGKKEWIENYPEDIKVFPFLQTIMGDSSDGLRGVYRVGAKGAEKALSGIPIDDYSLWKAVVKQYYLKEQTLEEAIATMRSVRMNQWTPEGGLVLWTPPIKP